MERVHQVVAVARIDVADRTVGEARRRDLLAMVPSIPVMIRGDHNRPQDRTDLIGRVDPYSVGPTRGLGTPDLLTARYPGLDGVLTCVFAANRGAQHAV